MPAQEMRICQEVSEDEQWLEYVTYVDGKHREVVARLHGNMRIHSTKEEFGCLHEEIQEAITRAIKGAMGAEGYSIFDMGPGGGIKPGDN